jgi:ABC-type dipeptide/oligopeptide/nickel transport system permease subunit
MASDALVAHSRPWAPVRLLSSHKAIAAGAIIVALVALVALLAPVLSPYDPNEVHPLDRLKGIGTPGYLLGADQQGRDMLSRLMWGARSSLAIAVLPLAISGVIGLTLGSIAGYMGRLPDTLIMRGMDIVFGLPPILLAIAVAATLGPGLTNLVLSLTIVLAPPMTRVTYQVVVSVRSSPSSRRRGPRAPVRARSSFTRSCPTAWRRPSPTPRRWPVPWWCSAPASASSARASSRPRPTGAG